MRFACAFRLPSLALLAWVGHGVALAQPSADPPVDLHAVWVSMADDEYIEIIKAAGERRSRLIVAIPTRFVADEGVAGGCGPIGNPAFSFRTGAGLTVHLCVANLTNLAHAAVGLPLLVDLATRDHKEQAELFASYLVDWQVRAQTALVVGDASLLPAGRCSGVHVSYVIHLGRPAAACEGLSAAQRSDAEAWATTVYSRYGLRPPTDDEVRRAGYSSLLAVLFEQALRALLRFSIAHELGHHLPNDDATPTAAGLSELMVEVQADQFAQSVLSPFSAALTGFTLEIYWGAAAKRRSAGAPVSTHVAQRSQALLYVGGCERRAFADLARRIEALDGASAVPEGRPKPTAESVERLCLWLGARR